MARYVVVPVQGHCNKEMSCSYETINLAHWGHKIRGEVDYSEWGVASGSMLFPFPSFRWTTLKLMIDEPKGMSSKKLDRKQESGVSQMNDG